MDYTALIRELVAPFLDGRALLLVILILLRWLTGIAAALKTEMFEWRQVGRWVKDDGLWLFGWFVITAVAALLNWGRAYLEVGGLTASARQLAEGVANVAGPGAFVGYVITLVTKVLINTATLGVTPNAPLPPSASARRP